jgi:hypothetical protein
LPGQGSLTETGELSAGLQNHNRTDEKTGEQDDGQRADADIVHLFD